LGPTCLIRFIEPEDTVGDLSDLRTVSDDQQWPAEIAQQLYDGVPGLIVMCGYDLISDDSARMVTAGDLRRDAKAEAQGAAGLLTAGQRSQRPVGSVAEDNLGNKPMVDMECDVFAADLTEQVGGGLRHGGRVFGEQVTAQSGKNMAGVPKYVGCLLRG